MGAIPAARLYHTKYRGLPPPRPGGTVQAIVAGINTFNITLICFLSNKRLKLCGYV